MAHKEEHEVLIFDRAMPITFTSKASCCLRISLKLQSPRAKRTRSI